ncbi:hypothetical protein GFS24_28450 [Chitinophaga sp. SYP-B3965]|uniref:hypothetical protein n=1 Tax=Chitinophaga sp. SYP-B3965 TaxID=2663120 RepID=UPI001299890F|nr:hypothetical protein [Chitinophaga sp. SYP-B3965]MRG49074.1 hypothetical protein [Chitinophaga sp. SYP-B3965]
MKLKQSILALGLLATAALSACEKDKNTAAGTCSVKIDNVFIDINKQLTATYNDTGSRNSFLIISGLGADNQAITINVVFPDRQLKPGTYILAADTYNYLAWYKSGFSEAYSADDINDGGIATITLETISATKAKGTFSGKLVNDTNLAESKIITEGKFDVTVLPMQ